MLCNRWTYGWQLQPARPAELSRLRVNRMAMTTAECGGWFHSLLIGATEQRSACAFISRGLWCPMPALFAYLLAIVVLLGIGYEGLEWLAEPLPAPTHESGIRPTGKGKVPAGKAEARPDVADSTPSADLEPTRKAAAETQNDGEPDKTVVAEGPAKAAGDTAQGECTPIGITAQGKLVFPMACQAVLLQKRDSPTAAQPNSAGSTALAKQAEPAAGAEANPTPKQSDAPGHADAPATASIAAAKTAKTENETTSDRVITPDKESAEHQAIKRKRTASRDVRPSRPKGVVMILRTIEFPDGHREQRLLSMNQWRRAPDQDERW